MPRILLPVMLLALASCSPEPESAPASRAAEAATPPAYQRFQGRYQGTHPREWSGIAGFCHEESERFLMLVGETGMVYFILPRYREWRTGDYAVNDLTFADPELSDPDVIYSELLGIDPREDKADAFPVDTDATSGTVRLDHVSDTHLTGTLRLNVRVHVADPINPSPPERATVTAAFDAYPVARCPEAVTGG